MKYLVKKTNKNIFGTIQLITSKSISNRLLIIKALQKNAGLYNLSESEDTLIMVSAFKGESDTIDAGHAGTAMRFLTAYLSNTQGDKILTGSDRMKNRPIGVLVDALRKLGAEIDYTEKSGFPPLRIKGKQLEGGPVTIDGSISSQYITALLLVAPALKNGLTLELLNKISSKPYIKLTIELMKYFGAEVRWDGNLIYVKPGHYKPREISVEADWSAASYWYEMVSFSDKSEINLIGLQQKSLQGDSVTADIFRQFGVETIFSENAVTLIKKPASIKKFEFDFSDYPDLVQTVAVTCVIAGIPFKISGAESLRIKETDRILALQNELFKFGAKIVEVEPGVLTWDGKIFKTEKIPVVIETYVDHRMAMAFAPAAMIRKEIFIKNPDVVVKSYPDFWTDLQLVGFEIEKQED